MNVGRLSAGIVRTKDTRLKNHMESQRFILFIPTFYFLEKGKYRFQSDFLKDTGILISRII